MQESAKDCLNVHLGAYVEVQQLQAVCHAEHSQPSYNCYHVARAEAKLGILPRGGPPVTTMACRQLGTHADDWLHA